MYDIAYMTDWAKALIMAAEQAREQAYAPYSQIAVGSALLGASGTIFGGANIENASYSAGICAERTAFARTLFAGEQGFKAIAIVGGPANTPITEYFYPCGICRQWMAEFCGPGFIVLAAKSADDYQQLSLKELLPHSFGPGHLR
jgi:homotetrameric cytidine deaminase